MLIGQFRRRNESEQAIRRASPWLARAGSLLRFPEPLMGALAQKIEVLEAVVDRDFAEQAREDPYRELFKRLDASSVLHGREPAKQILYLWLKTVFVNYVLAGERLDMARSVEVRLPLLDHKLFEMAREIPTSVLALEGQQKWVLREAARPFITDEVYRGVKRGFFAPPSALSPGNRLGEFVDDTLRGQTMSALPFFDQRAVARLLDRMASMGDAERAALDPLLLLMVSLCVLGERYRL